MNKISERIDLSKKALDIDLESPIFEDMRSLLDAHIQKIIKMVFDKQFQSGEINLKLNISIPTAYKTVQGVDNETGEMVEREYKYRKPIFEHKINSTLKKQFKDEGEYTEERDVQLIDDHFVAVPFRKNQLSFFDEENDEGIDLVK